MCTLKLFQCVQYGSQNDVIFDDTLDMVLLAYWSFSLLGGDSAAAAESAANLGAAIGTKIKCYFLVFNFYI